CRLQLHNLNKLQISEPKWPLLVCLTGSEGKRAWPAFGVCGLAEPRRLCFEVIIRLLWLPDRKHEPRAERGLVHLPALSLCRRRLFSLTTPSSSPPSYIKLLGIWRLIIIDTEGWHSIHFVTTVSSICFRFRDDRSRSGTT